MIGSVHNSAVVSVADGGVLDCSPISGEAVILNITRSGSAVLEFYDGVTSIEVDSQEESGSWMGMFLHCTTSRYYRIRNNSGDTIHICFDGVITGV